MHSNVLLAEEIIFQVAKKKMLSIETGDYHDAKISSNVNTTMLNIWYILNLSLKYYLMSILRSYCRNGCKNLANKDT